MSNLLIGSAFAEGAINQIKQARKNIDIAVYDWRWYLNRPGRAVQKFNIAILEAVNRGVVVRACVNNKEVIQQLKNGGVQATQYSDTRVLHAKLIWIDEYTLISGSHNFTERAFTNNIEVSTIQTIDTQEDRDRLNLFFNNIMPL